MTSLPERFDSRFIRFMAAVIVPGAVALVPWLLMAGKAYPDFGEWLFDNNSLSNATLLISIFCAGMIVENLGSRLEVRLDQEHAIDKSAWTAYLCQPQGSLVGHSYISSLVTRLKFELGLVFALPVAAVGLCIFAFCQNGMPHVPTAFLVPSGFFGALYLRGEAAHSVRKLNETRSILHVRRGGEVKEDSSASNPA